MADKKVAVVMGSDSDLETMSSAIDQLAKLGIPCDVRVLSAHRSPDAVARFAEAAESEGFEVIIAGAGKAAHLPGVIAAKTSLPVIGVPMTTEMAGGLDSLLSMAQMPGGVPVATMGTGKSGATNAAVLAAQILARFDPAVRQKLVAHKAGMAASVAAADAAVRQKLGLS
jgi:5-(carboxyamino)imidazole ribonucleotide mutase